MKKLESIIATIFFLSSLSLFSQNMTLNELNPEFVKALSRANNKQSEIGDIGGIPFPINLSYSAFQANESAKFPEKYDLRDLGVVAPVELQSSGGCWAYSGMSTVESRLLMLGEGAYDFSDNNLKYCHGFFDSRSTNGNAWMITAYFARQSGPLLEEQDPYPGGTSEPAVDCPIDEPSAFFIRESRYPSGEMANTKQLIIDIGSYWTLIYYNATYFDAAEASYFYGGTHEVNHVVNVVGWDDDKVTAGGVGAWICQNTYGTNWGENGFFYVSYNDTQLLKYNAYYPELKPYDNESRVLLYDELGNYNSLGFENETAYALCKFTADEDLLVQEIGTYAMAYGSTISMEVYLHYDEVNGNLSNKVSEVLPQITEHPGLYTFDLNNSIIVLTGNPFYIKIKYTTPGNEYPIPIEEFIETYSDPQIETGICWVSEDGAEGNWNSIGLDNTEGFKCDLSINVYGKANPPMVPLSNNIVLWSFLSLVVFYTISFKLKHRSI